jgi:hypothetical protein
MNKAAAAKVGASLVVRRLMREIHAKPGMPVWRMEVGEQSASEVTTVPRNLARQAVAVSASALERRRRRTFSPTGNIANAKFSRTPSALPTRSTLKFL